MKSIDRLLKSILRKETFRIREPMEGYSTAHEELILSDSHGSPVFSITPDRLICAASSSNYVVFYVHKDDGRIHEKCVRTTLSKVLKHFQPHLQQCHRSFLFNPKYVMQFNDISHNMYLTLFSPAQVRIPVSITYRDSVKETLHLSTDGQKG